MEHFKNQFFLEYAVGESGLTPPDVSTFTFPDDVGLGPLTVNQKFGRFHYASFDRQDQTRLNFLPWSPNGAHVDTNQNGVPEPNEPRLDIVGQTVTFDQFSNFLPTLLQGRYNYNFWDGIRIGNAPTPVDVSAQWGSTTHSVMKIVNPSYDIPYIPNGIVGDLTVASEIQIINTDCIDWVMQLNFLDTLTGEPTAAKIEGTVQQTHEFNIPAGSGRQFKVESSDDDFEFFGAFLGVNYDLGVPNLQLNVRYETRDTQGNLKGSAGISVEQADTFHTLAVRRDMMTDIGIGLHLPGMFQTTEPIDVKLVLVDKNNQKIGETTRQVKPGQSLVRFLGEFFDPNSNNGKRALPEEFEGTLLVSAPCDIVVFALQTENGFQQSSLTSKGSPMLSF
jgi:hypothetical protein